MDYSVTSVDLDTNKDEIISLWKENFPDLPPERYDWIYKNNPYGKALSWVAVDTITGLLVGITSLFPREMNVAGKNVRVGIAGDFAVNQEHRGFNVALKLQRAVTASTNQNNFKFLYGFSNSKAEPIQLRVGYVLLGRIERWAKLLTTRRYFKVSALKRTVSKPLDFILKSVSKEARYRRAETYTIQSLNSFDQRFDLLWERACKHFDIIGEKTKDYLNWRYCKSPHKDYEIFSLIDKNSREICGYVVYYFENKVVFIADMLFLDFDSALDSLLCEFILYLRSQEVESISILLFGCPNLVKKLRSFGFLRRDEESRILVYLDKSSPYTDIVLNKSNWLLLEGDRDI